MIDTLDIIGINVMSKKIDPQISQIKEWRLNNLSLGVEALAGQMPKLLNSRS